MLDSRHVSENLEAVRAGLARRSPAAAAAVDRVAAIAAERRALISETEALQARRNTASEEMGRLKKAGDEQAFAQRRESLRTLSDDIKEREARLAVVEESMREVLLGIPNVPDASVPDGAGSDDNPVVRTWGVTPAFTFEPKAHWDVGTRLGLLDFERGAKLSGARFTVLWGAAARLERALVTFMLDLHTREHGYTEVYPPFLVRAEALTGTGQLPKFEADLFKTRRSEGDEDQEALYLVPTAEVPVTNLHADEILDGGDLPIAYTAFTPCFRAEAGSYGKDVRGLIRQHQFDKVELVRFVEPEQGESELELLTAHAEEVLRRLGLHYRVVQLCAGDLGNASAKTYDLEVWLPGQGAYREISSCSWFTDYQARRARIRFRRAADGKKGKPRLVHTLNGSGLAVGRTLVAILEQGQQADGSVLVPEPLRGFMGTDRLGT